MVISMMSEAAAAPKEKRERGANWTDEERNCLLSLVELRNDQIENKRTDSHSLKKRQESWIYITKEFSVFFPPGKSVQKLKEQYQRLKCFAKKELSNYKNWSPDSNFPQPVISSLSERIKRIAPGDFTNRNSLDNLPGVDQHDSAEFSTPLKIEQVEAQHGEFDMDLEQSRDSSHADVIESDASFVHSRIEETHSEHTPTPRSRLKRTRLEYPDFTHKPANLTAEENKIRCQNEEHETRLWQMQEEHSLRIEVLRLKKELIERQIAQHDLQNNSLHLTFKGL